MGDLVMFQQMGFGVAVALLIDATLVRSVLVPAAMTLLGRVELVPARAGSTGCRTSRSKGPAPSRPWAPAPGRRPGRRGEARGVEPSAPLSARSRLGERALLALVAALSTAVLAAAAIHELRVVAGLLP